jgi:hypothetical protein
MNADKLFVFNLRLSAFIGGWVIFDVVTGVIYAVLAYALVVYWPVIKAAFARALPKKANRPQINADERR